jgi:hypothetical protein
MGIFHCKTIQCGNIGIMELRPAKGGLNSCDIIPAFHHSIIPVEKFEKVNTY